jgi:hypothetical protein
LPDLTTLRDLSEIVKNGGGVVALTITTLYGWYVLSRVKAPTNRPRSSSSGASSSAPPSTRAGES